MVNFVLACSYKKLMLQFRHKCSTILSIWCTSNQFLVWIISFILYFDLDISRRKKVLYPVKSMLISEMILDFGLQLSAADLWKCIHICTKKQKSALWSFYIALLLMNSWFSFKTDSLRSLTVLSLADKWVYSPNFAFIQQLVGCNRKFRNIRK